MAKDAIHYCKKQELWALIRKLGHLYGEDEETLREYAKDRYEACINDLDGAIACFRDLVKGSLWMEGKKTPWNSAESGSDRRVSTDP